MERLLVHVAGAAGADLLDAATERVVQDVDPRAVRPTLVAEPEVGDVRRLALQRPRRAAADRDPRADEAQVAADRERGERGGEPAERQPRLELDAVAVRAARVLE